MKHWTALVPMFLAAAILAGCGGDSPPTMSGDPGTTTGNDKDAVQSGLDDNESVLDVSQFMGEDEAFDMNAAGLPKTLDAIHTVRWWRTPTSIERSTKIEFAGGDSVPVMANVTITRDVEGILHLITAPNDSTREQLRKPFTNGGTRYAVFERRGPVPRGHVDRRRGWLLTQISGADVESDGATRRIESVSLEGASGSYAITDPLALVDVPDLPAFTPGEDVTVTVVTGDAADLVFLHSKGRRFAFQSQGNGTFTGTWHVPHEQGGPVRPFAIDVLSHGTLLDDTAPYDSRIWMLAYRVERVDTL